jgi:hypothetical protein
MRKKWWLISGIVFLIGFVGMVIYIPRIFNNAFENPTRGLENRLINEMPPGYESRIRKDFDGLILAFKKRKLTQEDLSKISEFMKSANEDRELDQLEMNGLLELIETIVPGLK